VLGHEQDAEDAYQATFLVLARRAAALHNKTAVASFLHGTAYHMALKAKRAAGRRRKYEGRMPERSSVNPSDELLWREVRALLDEEIARLPEVYRSAFVLCCLENLSRAEAGRRLGLKERTVSNRVAEARERLSQQLARRGVELTAVLAAIALATPAVPAALAASTVSAAVATVSGEGLAGVVSASVAELVQGATMMGKTKIAAAVLLAVTLLSGAGVCFLASPQRQQGTSLLALRAGKATANTPRSTKRETATTVEIRGRVFDPDGKPKAGAKLLLLREDGEIKHLGMSSADGGFLVAVPKTVKINRLVAQAGDTGLDFLDLNPLKLGKPVELRLVKDQVIRGRVVNTEGKPIRGARVAIRGISVYPNNSLDSFLAAWKKRHFQMGMPDAEKYLWSMSAALLPTKTDADGRFALHGAGAERVVSLHLGGAGIADSEMWIVNRDNFDPKPYNQASLDNIPKGLEKLAHRLVLHGPNVSVVAEAEKPIRGVVKDADSGKGRPKVVVYLTRKEDGKSVDVPIQATTDAEGRYEIHGAHKAKSYMLEVKDDPSTGYLRSRVWIDDTVGYDPITADIRVKKGVIVTGKILDSSTGKPVVGFAEADVLKNNPFTKDYPEFETYLRPDYTTAEDGVFRVVTIPGPVLLMGGPDMRWGGWIEMMKYKVPQADAKYPQYFLKLASHIEYSAYKDIRPLQGSFCKVLEIKPGAAIVKQDIILERLNALTVVIQDAEGRPLSGVWATGISPENWHRAVHIKEDCCSAYGVEPGKSRLLVFYQPDKKLAGTMMLKGDEKAPIVAKLGPMGAIKGRLLGPDGKPLASVVVEIGYWDREAEEVFEVIRKTKAVVTDAAGAFTFTELIPGRKFSVVSLHRRKRLVEEGSTRRKPIIHEVNAGECRDLGTIKVKPLSD